MNRAFVIAVALVLCNCASSSGVFAIGPDAYRVTASAITSFGGAGTAQRDALESAAEFCSTTSRQALIVSTRSDSDIAQGSSEVTFTCSDGSDHDTAVFNSVLGQQRAFVRDTRSTEQSPSDAATPTPLPVFRTRPVELPPLQTKTPTTTSTTCQKLGETINCTSIEN